MRPFASVLLFVVVACAPDLRSEYPFDGAATTGKLLTVAMESENVRRALVDASNKAAFVFVDLDGDTELKTDEALSGNGWELSFQRFKISMNGGAQNTNGKVSVALLTDTDFDALQQAPASGYQQDGADTVFNAVSGGWYAYDLGKHRLEAQPKRVYVVASSEGRYFKVQWLSYYDDAGSPAQISFRYAPLAAP
jgi:HmuY protein